MSPLMYARIAVVVVAMIAGGFLAHKFDLGLINEKNTEIANLKLKHETAVKDALVFAAEKQRSYDHEAIAVAKEDARRQSDIAADASDRVRALQSLPPRVLVRGCITYEFVRQLDAAIVAHGPANTLPLPTGKPADTCAPVSALDVVRWLLGVIETAQQNGTQLNDLIAYIRRAQVLR